MAIIRIGSQREYQQAAGSIQAPSILNTGPAIGAGVMDTQGSRVLRQAGVSLDGLKPLIQAIGKDYAERQVARVDDELLRAEGEFAAWKDEYRQEHQGRDGLNAAADYTRKHEELTREALARLDGNSDEVFEGLLKKRLAERGVQALKEGGAWAQRQGDVWKESQWQGQLASFERMVEENPGDYEGIQAAYKNLLGSWAAKNPGQDATAIMMRLGDVANDKRIESMIAQGDLDGAEAALKNQVVRDPRLHKGGTIAEDLCNPLNLKKPGANGGGRESFQVFQSDADGFRAAWNQLRQYQNGRRQLKTPRQMIATWAPASDGNNLEAYYSTVRRVTGLDLDAPIDMNSPEMGALLLKGMASHEGPVGRKHSTEAIAGYLRENGGVARRVELDAGPGMSPIKAARYQQRIDGIRRQQQARQWEGADLRARDLFAAWDDGNPVANTFTREEVLAWQGPAKGEALWRRMEESEQFALAANGMSEMTQAEQEAALRDFEPVTGEPGYADSRRLYERLSQWRERDAKERASDPVKYVIRHDATVGESEQAFLQNPGKETFESYLLARNAALSSRGMGGLVNPQDEAQEAAKEVLGPDWHGAGTALLFSKETGERLAAMLEGAENPKVFGMSLFSAMGSYGAAGMAQILKDSSRRVNIEVALLDEDSVKSLSEARKADPKFRENAWKVLANTTYQDGAATRKDFEGAIGRALGPLMATWAHGGDTGTAQALLDTGCDYGLALAMNNPGMEIEEIAARVEKKIVVDNYHLAEGNGGHVYRVPLGAGVDAERVVDGAEKYLGKIGAQDFRLNLKAGVDEKLQGRAAREFVRNNAWWQTNADESGLVLMLGTRALKRPDGTLIEITWAEAAALGREGGSSIFGATRAWEENISGEGA